MYTPSNGHLVWTSSCKRQIWLLVLSCLALPIAEALLWSYGDAQLGVRRRQTKPSGLRGPRSSILSLLATVSNSRRSFMFMQEMEIVIVILCLGLSSLRTFYFAK